MIKKIFKKIIGLNRTAVVNEKKLQVGTLNEISRIKWLEKTLKKIPKGNLILDAGAGEKQFKIFCSHLNYISQDFAQYKPDEIQEGLQVERWDYGDLDIISDIASIPKDDAFFDAIMCTEVFEHIINPRNAVKEFSRLLKSNGYLIITAPFCSITHFAPYHFYSGFNKYFYENELKSNGFKIIEITTNGNYFEYLAQELRRLPSVAQKYSSEILSEVETNTLNDVLNILENCSLKDKLS